MTIALERQLRRRDDEEMAALNDESHPLASYIFAAGY